MFDVVEGGEFLGRSLPGEHGVLGAREAPQHLHGYLVSRFKDLLSKGRVTSFQICVFTLRLSGF